MFQSFAVTTQPENGPPRLAALRVAMAAAGLDGFLIPRSDAHQGEYVAPCDERLSWLTGFTGSAGICAVTATQAGIFADGRYTVQARAQTAEDFTILPFPRQRPGGWLADMLPNPGTVGFDPWLHTRDDVERMRKAAPHLSFVESANLVDAIWSDRPAPPDAPIVIYPSEFAGDSSAVKRAAIAETLRQAGQKAAVLTLPDSICWLLNIRGNDIPRIPIAQTFAILHDTGHFTLFCDPAKAQGVTDHLGTYIDVMAKDSFLPTLATLTGPVRIDPKSAPLAAITALEGTDIPLSLDDDPCQLPKACKSAAEIAGTAEAHLRDGAAVVTFLAWLAEAAPSGTLTEIDVVKQLEEARRATGQLKDISFETISGAGPNGAIVHYRVSEATNRRIDPGDMLLVDSGAQYLDGTTDITRTMIVGTPSDEHKDRFTRVLKGMIAVSRARFPKGLAGRDIDALARAPLWEAGLDYDHGTGHGVGVYLSVHEGPQRLSRMSEVPLAEGMILSNEPGYYREGAYGIRIENLITVIPAPAQAGADDRDMLAFQTLTYVPIDRHLIDTGLLSDPERAWLDAYHADVSAKISPRVDGAVREWLAGATKPL